MLSKFDLFGIRIGLRYQQREQYQSEFGATITLIIFGLIIAQTYLVSRELIDKKNPDVIFSERYVASPQRYNMDKSNFNIAFGVQRGGTYEHFIDPSIYNVKAEQMIMKKIFNKTTNQYQQDFQFLPLSLQNCNQNSFNEPQTKKDFDSLPNVEQMYCIEQDSAQVHMEGDFSQESFAYLKITFTICDQSKDSLCQDPSKVQQQLQGSFVALYLNDIIINPKNQYPFEKVLKDFFWNSSPKIAKELTLNYRNTYIESDKGIFFEEKSYDREIALSNVNEQIVFDESKYFATIFVRFEKQKESVYYRKYKKIDSALAEVGGIAKALMILGFFICFPFNRLHLNYKIACQLFNFNEERQDRIKLLNKSYNGKESEEDKERKQQYINSAKKFDERTNQFKQYNSTIVEKNPIQIEIQTSNQIQQQNITNNLKKSDRNLQNDNNNNLSKKNQNKDGLNFNWYEFIRYYIFPWGPFKEKKEQLDFAIQKIYSHLDMLTIIHKLVELERMKTLLFDENQIKLIQFLPKPYINKRNITCSKTVNNSNNQNKSKSLNMKQSQINLLSDSCYLQDCNELKKSKSAFIALKNIFAKRKLCQVDTKIIQMLDDSFLSQIDQHIQEPLFNENNDQTFMVTKNEDKENNIQKSEVKLERSQTLQFDCKQKKEDKLELKEDYLLRKIVAFQEQKLNNKEIKSSFPEKICCSFIESNNIQQTQNVSEISSLQQSFNIPSHEDQVSRLENKYLKSVTARQNNELQN